jgi:hypothetical protein
LPAEPPPSFFGERELARRSGAVRGSFFFSAALPAAFRVRLTAVFGLASWVVFFRAGTRRILRLC